MNSLLMLSGSKKKVLLSVASMFFAYFLTSSAWYLNFDVMPLKNGSYYFITNAIFALAILFLIRRSDVFSVFLSACVVSVLSLAQVALIFTTLNIRIIGYDLSIIGLLMLFVLSVIMGARHLVYYRKDLCDLDKIVALKIIDRHNNEFYFSHKRLRSIYLHGKDGADSCRNKKYWLYFIGIMGPGFIVLGRLFPFGDIDQGAIVAFGVLSFVQAVFVLMIMYGLAHLIDILILGRCYKRRYGATLVVEGTTKSLSEVM